MDFSIEEAMDMIIELILCSCLLSIAMYFFVNCHKFYS